MLSGLRTKDQGQMAPGTGMYSSDCKEEGAQENHPIKLFMSSWAHPELNIIDIILTSILYTLKFR